MASRRRLMHFVGEIDVTCMGYCHIVINLDIRLILGNSFKALQFEAT